MSFRPSLLKRALLLAPLLVTVNILGLSATGAASGSVHAKALKTIEVRTGFGISPDVEAIYWASEHGYFAAKGLKISVVAGNGSAQVDELVGQGNDATFGWSIDAGTTALSISKGVPIRLVQVTNRTSPFGTQCYPSVHFKKPKDLEGKTVIVVPSESTAAMFPAYEALNGIDPAKVTLISADFSDKVTLFLAGKAQCMIGYATGDNLQAHIGDPSIPQATPWSQNGVKLLGDGVIASTTTVSKDPGLIRAFLAAVDHGYRDVCANLSVAVKDFNNRFASTFKAADRTYTKDALPIDCKNQTDPSGAPPFSPVTRSEWSAMTKILSQYGGLTPVLPFTDYVDNALLPAQPKAA